MQYLGDKEMSKPPETILSTVDVPNIHEFTKFVKVLAGLKKKTIKHLHDQIEEVKGTPQETQNWKQPSRWIASLGETKALDADSIKVAEIIREAGLNPRYYNYHYMRAAVRHGLITEVNGTLTLTDLGQAFTNKTSSAIDRYLYQNGCFAILGFLHEGKSTAKDLLPAWQLFANTKGGKKLRAESVLRSGLISRIDKILIPLRLIEKEGIPRRYLLTQIGAKKYESLRMEYSGADKQETTHAIAVDNILNVGNSLGYQTVPAPALMDLLPPGKVPLVQGKVFNKRLDGLWKTNLPLVGQIRIAIEVQSKGSIPDLLARLKIVAPYCHYMIVVSDGRQIKDIGEFISATGEEKIFLDRMIFLTFEELSVIRTQVTNVSSKLRPSFGDIHDEQAQEGTVEE